MFKIKDGYKLEFQTPETMKLFDRTKNLIGNKKICRKNVPSLEAVELDLIRFKLI